jgi:hypothetical protein
MFACLLVCMYGSCTNSHFWTDLNQTLHTSPPWSARDRRVGMYPKFLTSSTFSALFLEGGHCRIMGTRWLPSPPFSAISLYPWFQLVFAWRHRHDVVADGGVICGSLISVILAAVPLTSRKLRCSRRQSSATASYPIFRRVFALRHGYYVQMGDLAIRHSVISLILAPVSVTYRKSRHCRRQLCVPTPRVLHCR